MHATLTLPLNRPAPHRLPQRDYVIGYGEPLVLTVKLITEEGPDKQPVSLLGAAPAITFYVAGEGGWPFRDYGLRANGWARAMETAEVAEDGESATVTLAPSSSIMGRFQWLLTYGGPAGPRFLAQGSLEVLPSGAIPDWPAAALEGALVTEGGDPILVVGD